MVAGSNPARGRQFFFLKKSLPLSLPPDLGGKYGNSSYIGWTLRKQSKDAKEGGGGGGDEKKRGGFNFSGTLKTLPEFHRGLCRLAMSASTREIPDADEILKIWQSEEGEGPVDISNYGHETYTKKAFSFQDFRLYVDDVLFRSGNNGGLVSYETICLTKRKSERAMKTSRSGDPGFFIVHIPIRKLKTAIAAVRALMKANNLKPLPLKRDGEDDGENDEDEDENVEMASDDEDSDSSSSSSSSSSDNNSESESDAEPNPTTDTKNNKRKLANPPPPPPGEPPQAMEVDLTVEKTDNHGAKKQKNKEDDEDNNNNNSKE